MEEISTILRGSVSKAKEAGSSVKGNGISIQDQIDIESRTALNYAKENKDNETGNTKTDRRAQPTSGKSNGRIAEIALLTGATDESGKPSIQGAQPSKSELDNGRSMEDKPQRVSLGAIEESNGFTSTIASSNTAGSISPNYEAEELEELESRGINTYESNRRTV